MSSESPDMADSVSLDLNKAPRVGDSLVDGGKHPRVIPAANFPNTRNLFDDMPAPTPG